ncbi:MAG: hypothetical protein ACBR15_22550 [Microcoleus sp.]
MGNLIDLNSQIPDSRIPAGIARDTETTAAINAHIVAVDPHPIYLTQAEGDGRYRQTATALTDADIPAAIARDVEVTAAVTAHVAAADPHPVYLTQTEGDGRYRQTATALTDADIPAAIARDTEVTAAVAAHVAAADPHPVYLTQAEGDGRYRQTATALTDADIPAAIARDAEVTAAVAAHAAAADLHNIRFKVLNFTAGPPSTDGSVVYVPHGLAPTKILGFSVSIEINAAQGFWVGPNYFLSPGQVTGNRFLATLFNGNLMVENYGGDSANIASKPGRAIVWHLP